MSSNTRVPRWTSLLATTSLLGFGLLAGLSASPASAADAAEPGSSPDNPIVVSDPSEVPAGAVEDAVSTYDTPAACDTTRSWVLTIPATEDKTHQEFRFKRDVPAVQEVSHQEWAKEHRTRDKTPTSVTEYRYREKVPGHAETTSEWCKFKTTKTWYAVEHKKVKTTNKAAVDWLKSIGATDLGGDWWQIPTRVINAAHVDLGSVGQSGNVNLSAYGGPSVTVPYEITGVDGYESCPSGEQCQSQSGTVYWTGNGHWSPWSGDAILVKAGDGPSGWTKFDCVQKGNGDGTPDTWGEWSNWSTTNPGPASATKQVETRQVAGEPVYGPWSDWSVVKDHLTSEPTLPANTDTEQWRATGPVKVVDVEAQPGYTEYFVLGGEPSRDEDDASWVREEQSPGGDWVQFGDPRTVTDEVGTPEQVIYYAYSDGAECEKPEPYEHTTHDSKCVGHNLVVTDTTVTGTPVQAEDGSWTIQETSTSSQHVVKNAARCTPHTGTHNPPTNYVPPATGGDGTWQATSTNWVAMGGLAGVLLSLAAGMGLLTLRRRVRA